METNTTPATCSHDHKIVKCGIVRCADIACDKVIDASGSRPGLIARNQNR